MTKREGPKLTIKASCFDCEYNKSQSYASQNDSGCVVYCTHPEIEFKRIGDTTWDTPEWCPLLKFAMDELFKSKTNGAE